MRRIILPAALLVAATIALAGCSAGASDSYTSGGSAPESAPNVAQGQEFSSTDGDKTLTDGTVAADGSSAVDRQVVTTGYMTITAKDPLKSATEATKIVEGVGGRVDARNEYAPANGDNGSATLTLRLPASSLTATLEKLKALGDVVEISTSANDVTMQTQDLDAQIKALSASVDRLVALLSTATDTDTLITLESAISDRQGQLDSLISQKRYLSDQVALSTITLNLQSVASAPVETPDTFWSGLQAGWLAFVAFFSGLLVVLGVLLPWLVLAAIITVLIVALVRRSNRRKQAAWDAQQHPVVAEEFAAPTEAPTAPAKPARKAPAAKK
ncbi:MAG: DUF4349 domain-containing protein [Rhodoglobus sp.]